MSDELIRQQITDIIEGEIQNGINDYLEGNEQDKDSKGFGGSVPQDEGKELKVNVSKNEVDRLIKEYKKIKKSQKSNLGQVKKMGLLDKDGNPI
jgi:hypothetical protein|tara:strand:+ start:752 stop:1033 length:282 start_codon:yes stop_codon:yes gene_type:complete